ncbi:carboxymethylenebutenolidase [Actinomycetospora succinea]|uniref:Carboxymethylenebutenolidase n=1 Tax=Actinomycetospora succinea TaxID=663603 RepID=A0A4R6VTG9_9PSEU|nr:ester cyclase [Actinomycetospora succinea]TDQ65966.1 carboxymethylenebutenolidase [Actinomycetospora succinea]
MTKAVQDMMVAVERARDAFAAALHAGDLDAALGMVTDDVALSTLPAGTGARGADALRRHLADDVLPHRPADLEITRVSRTTDRWRVVDEQRVAFTHDRAMPWLLPGAAPTGRRAEVLAITVVAVRREKITEYRTLWDHHGLLEQLGLLPAAA